MKKTFLLLLLLLLSFETRAACKKFAHDLSGKLISTRCGSQSGICLPAAPCLGRPQLRQNSDRRTLPEFWRAMAERTIYIQQKSKRLP